MRVWDLSSGNEVCNVKGLEGELKTVVFFDDKRVITGGASKLIYICNLETGKVEKTLSGAENAIARLGRSAKDTWIAALDDQGNGYVWDTTKGIEETTKAMPLPRHPGATGALRQIRFNVDGSELWATGDFPHLVRWKVDGWQPDGELSLANDNPNRQFATSYNGLYLMAATERSFCTAEQQVGSHEFKPGGRVMHASSLSRITRILPMGADYFALLGGDGAIEFWRGRDEQFAGQFPADVNDVTAVTFDSWVKRSVTGHADGTISIWHIDAVRERSEDDQTQQALALQKLLTTKKFDELTDAIDKLRREHTFDASGEPALHTIYLTLAAKTGLFDSWDSLQSRLSEWEKAKPKSVAPLIVEAEALKCEGWQARGNGFAGTVGEEGWKRFGEKLNRALEIIDRGKQLDEKDAALYRAEMEILMGLGQPLSDIDTACKAGAEIDANYFPLYEQVAIARLPRWSGGSPAELAKWAGDICDEMKQRGDEAYLHIALALACYARTNIFKESELDWERIKRGLDEVLPIYDDSSSIANGAGFLAVLMQDQATARKILPILGLHRNDPKFWDSDQMRRWQKWAMTEEVPVSKEQEHVLLLPKGADGAVLSSDGRVLVAVGKQSGGHLQVWGTQSWQSAINEENLGNDLMELAIHPTKPMIAIAGGPIAKGNEPGQKWSYGLEVCEFNQDQVKTALLHGHSDVVNALAFAPDGGGLATGSLDSSVRLWKVPLEPKPEVLNQPSGVVGLAYSSDGKSLFVATAKDGVLVWDLSTKQQTDKLPEAMQNYSPEERLALACSHSGLLVAYLNAESRVTVYNAEQKSTVCTLPKSKGSTLVISFSPDDKLLATAGEGKKVELWEAATGKLVHFFTGHHGTIRSLQFFPKEEKLLSLGDDSTLRVWDISSISGK